MELQRDADRIDLAVEVRAASRPWDETLECEVRGSGLGVVAHTDPTPDQLVALADFTRSASLRAAVALVASRRELRSLAHDLGIVAVEDSAPLCAAIALLNLDLKQPWAVSSKGLSLADRARVGHVLSPANAGALVHTEGSLIGYSGGAGAPHVLGQARDVGAALFALRAAQETTRPRVSAVEGVDRQAVLDVILGPERALSDPASKAALAQYDLPLPIEELCATPSRAAAEAARIGFPVRVVLASPDLRIWEHRDLVANDVVGGAAVREAYRQLTSLAQSKSPGARVLGVTVSAATVAHALLRVRLQPLKSGLVLTEIGFADSHGVAANDVTQTILPATAQGIERALSRLEGSSLILEGTAADRKMAVTSIGDVLLRLTAFTLAWRAEIASVEVNPLALVVGGGIEVREACVTVGDAFSRSLRRSS